MRQKSAIALVMLLFISQSILDASAKSQDNIPKWDEDWSYSEEIIIPIDTNLPEAKNQPMDLRIQFKNPCWTKDEKESSLRVVCWDGKTYHELESQIYDLKFETNENIRECRLVFLIPEFSNGKERYFVMYDDTKKESVSYENHLTLGQGNYYYEPISGQKIEIDYFKIVEDGYIVYGISSKGTLLGEGVSQVVAKFKPGSTTFEAKNIDQFCAFAFLYSAEKKAHDYKGSSFAKKASAKVLVDGNLMKKIQIESISPEGEIKTNNIYTYYYCPKNTKKLYANVNHEILETITIDGSKNLPGSYANLLSFKGRSSTIEDLNIGDILPLIYVNEEDNIIRHYPVPTDPTTGLEEMVLLKTDDIDLGENAWFCMQEPSTGKAHGLIFSSNENIIEGKEDGIQVVAFVQQLAKFPGIEGDVSTVYGTRNSYELGDSEDCVIPKGFNISFNAEYITVENQGYEAIDKESKIFQQLISTRLNSKTKQDLKNNQTEGYPLTIFLHNARSSLMGELRSVVFGKNRSYIKVEIYKNNTCVSSGVASRLPLFENIDLDENNQNIFQKIKEILGFFDWKNISFFKKIVFPNLKPDTYVIKIYRENPFLKNDRQYIGYKIVEIKQNTEEHIWCGIQGSIHLTSKNQKNEELEKVQYLLLENNEIIADAYSDEKGFAILNAPCSISKLYVLQTLYQGFLIKQEEIKLGLKSDILPAKKSIEIPNYNLNLEITDTWGMNPSIDIAPTLTSKDMTQPGYIYPEKQEAVYVFKNLYPEKYTLNLRYKSIIIKEEITVDKDTSEQITFPAEFKIELDLTNSYGMKINNAEIKLERNDRTITRNLNGEYGVSFSVPPGEYNLKVYSNDRKIAEEKMNVFWDRTTTIVAKEGSLFHDIFTVFGIILIFFSFYLLLIKKKLSVSLKTLAIALIILAVFSSWWSLQANQNETVTNTNVFLVPNKIVTLTQAENYVGGEIASLTSEAPMVLNILLMLLVIAFSAIIISIYIKKRYKKTTNLLSIFIMIVLIGVLSIFYYAMTQITQLSVGSVIGSGKIQITIPGESFEHTVSSTWGLDLGFYFILISLILILVLFINENYLKNKKA
jgi:hypothetical protein